VVPYPQGSVPDLLARLLGEEIARARGPSLLVENRPGAATRLATDAVARSAPDGSTLLLVANSFAINPSLQPSSYDVSESFEPVCQPASPRILFVVRGSSPYRTLADLVAGARARPGELTVGSSPASSLQIAFEVFRRAANVDMPHLPFVATRPAISNLVDGY